MSSSNIVSRHVKTSRSGEGHSASYQKFHKKIIRISDKETKIIKTTMSYTEVIL